MANFVTNRDHQIDNIKRKQIHLNFLIQPQMKTTIFTLACWALFSIHTFAQPHISQFEITATDIHYDDGITTIRWEVTEEINASYYIVERQIKGQSFEIIGTMACIANAPHRATYTFEDSQTRSQKPVHYRITLVWMDGTRLSTNLPNLGTLDHAIVRKE